MSSPEPGKQLLRLGLRIGDETAAEQEHMNYICRSCGSTKSQAMADARTLGFEKELRNGFYNCCQIAAWADEQWLAWVEAARQDGKPADVITKPLECDDAEAVPIVFRYKHNHN